MSFKLYNYVLSGNCYKVRLFAGVLGINYDSIAVDFHPGQEHKSDDLMQLNPAGTLPIMIADDLVLTETSAMLIWMASKFDSDNTWWPATDAAKTAAIVQWLGFSSDLTSTIGEARLHTMLNRDVKIEKALADGIVALRRIEAQLTEQGLRGGAWLVGESPTIADIACFPYVALAPDAGLEHDDYPAIRNWLYAIRSLSGFVTMPGIHEVHELRNEGD